MPELERGRNNQNKIDHKRVLKFGVGAYPFPPNTTMLLSSDRRSLSRRLGKDMYVGINRPEVAGRYWLPIFSCQEPKQPQPLKNKNGLKKI